MTPTAELKFNPYVLDCVEAACRRKAAALGIRMGRGIASLASVSATALLFGLLGTVIGIMNSFRSMGTSKSEGIAGIAQRLSESLLTTIAALIIAVVALSAYRYLSGVRARFLLDMENQSVALVNALVVYLRRSGNTQPLYFGEKSKRHLGGYRSLSTFGEGLTDAPVLEHKRIYRNGLLELLWPRSQSNLDTGEALRRGMWITVGSAALTYWLYSFHPFNAAILSAFLLFAGFGILRGSFFTSTAAFVFLLLFTVWRSVTQQDFTLLALVWGTTALCLVGSARPAWAVSHGRLARPLTGLSRWSNYVWNAQLVCLGLAATMAVPANIYIDRIGIADTASMEPGLHPHEQVFAINTNWFGGLSRGDVALFSLSWDTLFVGRLVGVPGDRLQVRAGKLIRNGKPVDEPYCRIPYSEKLDRFASEAKGDSVTVPEDSYLLLKDDRNGDSRFYGPVTRDQIVGRVILAYGADEHRWWHLSLVH